MKKRYLIKIFSLTICLSILFSNIAFAKNINNNSKVYKARVYCVDPHPDVSGVPMD